MAVKGYRELIVWQKAMQAAEEVYALVKKLPKEETYAMSDQVRRAAVSIPSNIAEGQSRNSTKEFIQFLSIANGSKAELETQLDLCVRIGMLQTSDIETTMSLLSEIGKMINAMIWKLNSTLNTQH